MTERMDLYKCEICGNIVQIMHAGEGNLVCCGQNMNKLEPKQQEEGAEKHIPSYKNNIVQIGSVIHPMIDEHYIHFIQCISEDKKNIIIKFLNPSETPSINLNESTEYTEFIEYCNIHGLWKGRK